MFRLLSCLLLISSCVSSNWETKMYDPHKGGIVSYLNEGADFAINKRRADAIKKIRDFCYEDYKILREDAKYGSSQYQSTLHCIGNSPGTPCIPTTQTINSSYIYITFVCK